MSLRYLLPCSCGHKIAIAPRQAGETLVCRCGKSVEVPTLREIRQLAEDGHQALPSGRGSWNLIRGLAFAIGTAVLFSGLAVMAFFGFRRTQLDLRQPSLDDVQYPYEIMDFTPSKAWDMWTQAFRGKTLSRRVTPRFLVHRKYADIWGRYMIMAGIMAGLGAVFALGSLIPWSAKSG